MKCSRVVFHCLCVTVAIVSLCRDASAAPPGAPNGPTSGPAGLQQPLLLARPSDHLYWAESNCCGLVAFSLVAQDFNKSVTLDDVAKTLPVTSAGTSMLGLRDAFAKIGLAATGAEVDVDHLYEILETHPNVRAVAQLRPEHWVAVFGASENTFEAFWYPSWVHLTRDTMKEQFRGNVLFIGSETDINDVLAGPARMPAASHLLLVFAFVLQGGIAYRLVSSRSQPQPQQAP
jgi:hypothetical protein